jgi:hypothetical protein
MHSARVARRKLERVKNRSMLETWQSAINIHIAVSSVFEQQLCNESWPRILVVSRKSFCNGDH